MFNNFKYDKNRIIQKKKYNLGRDEYKNETFKK
jgi:hypothetical protein